MNYKYILTVLVIMCLTPIISTAKVNEKKFSSSSTVCRQLDLEKDKEYKAKFKQFKKKYNDIKDIAIEQWNDGKTYYVLYDDERKIALIQFDTEKLLSPFNTPMFYDNIEFVERRGGKYFRIHDNDWMFYNGSRIFNPNTVFKEFGGEEYVVIGEKPINIYDNAGTLLLQTDGNYEFRTAEKCGLTHDKNTGISIYHPDLPNRFLGHPQRQNKNGYFDDYLGCYIIDVPGGEYLIKSDRQLPQTVTTEVRDDINGNIHEYKVFTIGNEERVNSLRLCYNSTHKDNSVLPRDAYKVKISTPDQVVYYNCRDYNHGLNRMGCVSLIDTTFKVAPVFNDVKVFYDGKKNPYALVKLSALSPYELYDPYKSYDYSQTSEIQKLFDQEDWNGVIRKVQPSKLDNFPVENLYPWLYAEIESLKNIIEYYNEYILRLNTGSLHTFEEQQLTNNASYYTPIQFGPTVEEALSAHISKIDTAEADKYKLMLSYLKMLKKQKTELEDKKEKAEANYADNKRKTQASQDAARQKMVMNAVDAHDTNTNCQQTIMVGLLRSLFGVNISNNSPMQQTTSSSNMPPKNIFTPSLLEQTSIAPEIVGAAMVNGWTPDTPSATTSEPKHTNTSSGNICHACFGSKRCGVCSGKGRYMPNLDGKYIDCTSCGKSGNCKQCNGQGHH